MKKETKKEIDCILIEKGFLNKNEVLQLSKKEKCSFVELADELLNLKIPFCHKNLKIVLQKNSIEIKNTNEVILDDVLNLGEWVFNVFKKSKINVTFKCKICSQKSRCKMSKFFNRKHLKNEPICSKCILRETVKTKEWKRENSEAQIIAQNKPEQIKKNSDAQIERYKDENVIRKCSDNSKKMWENPEYRIKLEKIAQDKWKNPEYAKKVIQNSKKSYVNGEYKGLYYDSSYELAFILKLEYEHGDLKSIKRANFYISYKNKNGKSSCYYPDFILDEKFLVEVKGKAPWIDLENLELKNKAGYKWCLENKMKFRLVELKDFGYHWLGKALKKHKEIKNGEIKK